SGPGVGRGAGAEWWRPDEPENHGGAAAWDDGRHPEVLPGPSWFAEEQEEQGKKRSGRGRRSSGGRSGRGGSRSSGTPSSGAPSSGGPSSGAGASGAWSPGGETSGAWSPGSEASGAGSSGGWPADTSSGGSSPADTWSPDSSSSDASSSDEFSSDSSSSRAGLFGEGSSRSGAAGAGRKRSSRGRSSGGRRGGGRFPDGPDADSPAASGPNADPESVARAVCLRLLTMAPKTRAQLAEALRKRDIPDEAAESVLDRFSELGLINDEAFAEAWVDSRHHGRGLAKRALASELRRRGVDSDTVNEAVERLDPDQEAETARRLVERKLAATRSLDPQARTRRLAGMLARKGYSSGLAFRVIREALEQEGLDLEESDFP
ncbi:recombination regulator RecX, partial [Nonomuraea sp. NN258]|uniref:recombination regulator RecX n=1 Tax=Nonomuraea antri TaxID=2730852 RepID=UPI001569BF05|nr:recombination regulator RecX [Nonomuraea antri]